MLTDCVSALPNEAQRELEFHGLARPRQGTHKGGRYAPTSEWAKPGTLQLHRNSPEPQVVALRAQWAPGAPAAQTQPQPAPARDDIIHRRQWLSRGLRRLAALAEHEGFQSIAFAHDQVNQMDDEIRQFAASNPDLMVYVVQQPDKSMRRMRRLAYADVKDSAARARAFIKRECEDAFTKRVARALCDSIESDLYKTIDEKYTTADVTAAIACADGRPQAYFEALQPQDTYGQKMADVFSAALDEPPEVAYRKQQEAVRVLRANAESIDEHYREQRLDDYRAGRTTLAELETEAAKCASVIHTGIHGADVEACS